MVHSPNETAVWPNTATERLELATVYREHVRYVWRCVRHLGVREADIEDVAHEVFLVVGRKLGDFEGRSRLQTWIYGITLRVCGDYRKRASFRREVSVAEYDERSGPNDPVCEAERSQLRARLLGHLDSLAAPQREVFVLYELEELSMSEVAEIVGTPLQTAYSRLRAARESLRARLLESGVNP